jgi:hypothetical protein
MDDGCEFLAFSPTMIGSKEKRPPTFVGRLSGWNSADFLILLRRRSIERGVDRLARDDASVQPGGAPSDLVRGLTQPLRRKCSWCR